ncbi:hypothetical protein OV079_04920 [Nannocystis pusilla]|uniref:Uncharacterized protein n=1 Tax=Nannocystis pusilla TaxID=889268 RepID=A0A9X3EJP2_9BACT|nr:hypothetical protein [Nannocystis pusilla]MCY1004921.1 hypothetical protein [Nannocystis pusilla]
MPPDDPARARILDAAQELLDLRAGPLRLADVAVRAGLARVALPAVRRP